VARSSFAPLDAVRFLRSLVDVPRFILPLFGAGAGAAFALVRERQKRAERLAAATFETLLNAVDANDAVTGAHVRRVATYALILADALGLPEHQRRDIERVALFHDIGKLHAALFDIIHDDAQLSSAERRAIATHPARGAEVLEPLSAFYPTLAAGVLAHHERWDGHGYPRKLRGTEIPLASRIVAVADTFDAITGSRRYRRAEGMMKALDVIRRGRGAQFDPELADTFVLPWVVDAVTRAMREAHAPRRRTPNRRQPTERWAPDVSFRWHQRVERPRATT
jgi:HD-GYP domain-containing protein (c-di-GMP phosphodiesterase class II)